MAIMEPQCAPVGQPATIAIMAPVSHNYGIQWEFLWMVDIFLAIFHQTYGKDHGKYHNFFWGMVFIDWEISTIFNPIPI